MQALRKTGWIWAPPLIAALLMAAILVSGSNHALFLLLNHAGHAIGQAWWDNLTILGDAAIALALALPMVRRAPRCFWAGLIAALIVGIGVQLFKHWLPVPRPLAVLAAESFFQSGPQLRAGSFPSGHAATAFILAGIVIMGLPGHRLLRWFLLALAVLVGISRIMVGVHWPLDVLAGMVGGWGAAYAGLLLSDRLKWDTRSVGGIMAGLLLSVVAAGLLFSRHTGYASTLPLQHLIGICCLVFGAGELCRMLPHPYSSGKWRKAEDGTMR